MTKNYAIVSVVMSVYNEEINVLSESVSSILKQTLINFEFIIVDDNPQRSDLPLFFNSINDNRVKVIYNKKNLGLAQSLNIALKYVSTPYVARMDADDIAMPFRLERQLDFIKKNNVDLVASNIKYFNDENDSFYVTHYPKTNFCIRFLYMNGLVCLPHPTWFAKKNFYDSLNGYRTFFKSGQDLDLILRAMNKRKRFGILDEVTLKYRVRNDSISNSNSKIKQALMVDYLVRNRKRIDYISQNEIDVFLETKKYNNEATLLKKYNDLMYKLKNNFSISVMFKIISNKYFYKYIKNSTILHVFKLNKN